MKVTVESRTTWLTEEGFNYLLKINKNIIKHKKIEQKTENNLTLFRYKITTTYNKEE